MARDGDGGMILGERLIFRETGRDADGEFLRYETSYKRGGIGSRRHVHVRQDERHELLTGSLRLEIEDEEQRLDPGDVAMIPAGATHRALRIGEGDVVALIELHPPLKYEEIFDTFTALRRDGKLTKGGWPKNPLLGAVLFSKYEDESRLIFPPRAIQRATLGPLAALGRALGYEDPSPPT
jgi:mannose-6-phosphate isomerase-like protein (cupin superfamily)